MNPMSVPVRRLPIQLLPDASRVITRFFGPGEENRIRDIVGRLLAVPETAVAALVANLERDFRPLHPDIDGVFLEHYEAVKHHIPSDRPISDGVHPAITIAACVDRTYPVWSRIMCASGMRPAYCFMLVLPYAASDLATSIAVIDLKELLGSLIAPPGGR